MRNLLHSALSLSANLVQHLKTKVGKILTFERSRIRKLGGYIMGYYDFNDHFWSPKEVCGQLPPKTCKKRVWGIWKLTGSVAGAFSRKYDRVSPDLSGSRDRIPPD